LRKILFGISSEYIREEAVNARESWLHDSIDDAAAAAAAAEE
jgi:hypothetical protein